MESSEAVQPILSVSFVDLLPYVGAIIPIAVSAFVCLLTFAFTMGNSAYYRIPTQYGIASLPMAICQIIAAGFAIVLVLVATAFVGDLIVAIIMLLVAFVAGAAIVVELRDEVSTIEWGAIAIGVVLCGLTAFANLYSPYLSLVGSEVELFGLRFAAIRLISLAIAMTVIFFEAGYIAAKHKRFYLVDPERGNPACGVFWRSILFRLS